MSILTKFLLALAVATAAPLALAADDSPYPATATPQAAYLDLGLSDNPPPVGEVLPLPTTPAPVAEESVLQSDAFAPAEPQPSWYQPTYWIGPVKWDTGVELGLNGSSGTSDSLSMRVGGFAKQESKSRKIKFDIYHNRTRASGVETQNNAQANYRHEWLFADSPWTLYGLSQLYYDEFQEFDLNLNLNMGVGYRFWDLESSELTGRLGSGASREFGGPEDEWVPEAQFGLEYEQQLSKTQKMAAKFDYFPEWEGFADYRLITDISWEVQLQVPSNVSLKFAATDRYDSDPGDAEPHNLNYSVLLLWKR